MVVTAMRKQPSSLAATEKKIRVGVSSCLLGQRVRYDGNHKQDDFIVDTLGRFFEWVPLCPEMAIGLGVPRPPIRLVGSPSAPRAVGVKDPSMDVTGKLAAYGKQQARKLNDISGYIFKSKSPSCGMERVKIYGPANAPRSNSRGIYANAFLTAQPCLPAEEEGRLGNPRLRENFIERVLAYYRWQILVAEGLTAAHLVEFHTRHKLTLMAHSVEAYRALGQLVAQASRSNLKNVSEKYLPQFMQALHHLATPARHTNVLMHIMGYLKKHLDAPSKAELLGLIHAYRRGEIPLAAPRTLLIHYFRLFPDPYIARQIYLYAEPQEMLLRGL